MGNSGSEEYRALVRQRKVEEWIVLEERGAAQIWMQIATSRRYLVFAINAADIESEQKLQLYSFRKQNRTNLVTVECILVEDSSLFCSQSHQCYLLVEYVPFRLKAFRNRLSFEEALVVLNGALAGYTILNYIYGPMNASEDMICINEQGVPKVWINENLSLNQPSKSARYFPDQEESAIGELTTLTKEKDDRQLESKTYHCMTSLIKTVEDTAVEKFPAYFSMELQKLRNFEEGEEFLSNFCRKNGIALDQRISLEKANRVGPRPYTPIHSDRVMASPNSYITPNNPQSVSRLVQSNVRDQRPTYLRTEVIEPKTFKPATPRPPSNVHFVLTPPPLKVSTNSDRNLNFVYNQPRLSNIPVPAISQPPKLSLVQSLPANQERSTKAKETEQPLKKIKPSQQKSYSLDQFTPQIADSIDNSEIQRSYPIECSFGNFDKPRQVTEVIENDSSEVSKDSGLFRPSIRQSKEYTLPNKNESKIQETQSRELGNTDLSYSPRTLQQLKLWQQSLFKLSEKKIEKDWPKGRSRFELVVEDKQSEAEPNKVILEQNANSVYQYGTESDLENYVRDKYSSYMRDTRQIERKLDYFEYEGQPQENSGLYSSGFKDKENLYGDRGRGREQRNDYGSMSHHVPKLRLEQTTPYFDKIGDNQKTKQLEKRKVTFDRGYEEPINLYRKEVVNKRQEERSYNKKAKDTVPNASYNRIEQRYAKYVKNKDQKTTKNKEINVTTVEKELKTNNGRDSSSKVSKSFRKDASPQATQERYKKQKISSAISSKNGTVSMRKEASHSRRATHSELQLQSRKATVPLKKESDHKRRISYSELSDLLRT